METLVREDRTKKGANGQQAMDRFVAPAATVRENGDGYTLQVEMPGVNKEGLEMWVENNELTIVGSVHYQPWPATSFTASPGAKTSGGALSSIRRSTLARSAPRLSRVW